MQFETQIDALLALADRIWKERPDVRQQVGSTQQPEFWSWLGSYGLWEYAEVRELCVPIPPERVRRHSSAGGDSGYLLTGAGAYRLVWQILRRHPPPSLRSILDFGCGAGRVLRFMHKDARQYELTGCDVDSSAIGWCRRNFSFGEFRVTAERPPLSFADETFDVVYSISVFSHLSEAIHLEWLRELQRVMKPGGILIATVHGRHALRRALQEESCRQTLGVGADELAAADQELSARGFAFVPQSGGHLSIDLYGVTFLDEGYVKRMWAPKFELLDFQVAALDHWQDAVVLRRP
jgi:SAM-dependent methyltransferase